MNIAEVINDIKLTLGLNTIALPYDSPVETVIAEILKVSIRTFSQFKPQIKEGYESINKLRSMNDHEKSQMIFYLPSDLTTTHVHTADAVLVSSSYDNINVNASSQISPFVGYGAHYRQDIMNATNTGAAINKYNGMTTRVPTSKWRGYNKIQLFDFPLNGTARFTVKCDHDSSGESITDTCRESFISLATLDVQRTLYNTLKNMNEIGGAHKKIQLQISDWASAEASRNELIKSWNESFYLDDPSLVQFF